jgi:hypothetical protein
MRSGQDVTTGPRTGSSEVIMEGGSRPADLLGGAVLP